MWSTGKKVFSGGVELKIELKINGVDRDIDISPDEMLLDVLRRYGCLSVKRGCDTGSCGICTVHLDGKPILSCSYYAAKAEGHEITTIEGVQKEAEEVGTYLVNEGTEQCGYCSPSLIMTVLALKKEIENPTEEDINHYLKGNLCRCSGYEGHLRAIKKYLGVN